MSENAAHGPSVITLIADKERYRVAFKEKDLKDPEFEYVYAAEEVFADGYARVLLCWRRSDWHPQPPAPRNQPVKKRPPLTYLTPVVHYIKKEQP